MVSPRYIRGETHMHLFQASTKVISTNMLLAKQVTLQSPKASDKDGHSDQQEEEQDR